MQRCPTDRRRQEPGGIPHPNYFPPFAVPMPLRFLSFLLLHPSLLLLLLPIPILIAGPPRPRLEEGR